MKVVFKKTILDKLHEAIFKARRDNKNIEYIELTHDEYHEFRMEMSRYHLTNINYRGCPSSVMYFNEFHGTEIRRAW